MTKNLKFITYKSNTSQTPDDFEPLVNFLHEEMGRFGDPKWQIRKAIRYALSETKTGGGFVKIVKENNDVLGAVVMNSTGMEGYIPENILVYIAVRADQRGKGIGTELLKKSIDEVNGDVALHVEPDNPALRMYERLGFSNKYLEMRYDNGGRDGIINTR